MKKTKNKKQKTKKNIIHGNRKATGVMALFVVIICLTYSEKETIAFL